MFTVIEARRIGPRCWPESLFTYHMPQNLSPVFRSEFTVACPEEAVPGNEIGIRQRRTPTRGRWMELTGDVADTSPKRRQVLSPGEAEC